MADMRAVLCLMGKVTPKLFASNPLLHHSMRIVLECVRRGMVGLRAADEVLSLEREMTDSLLPGDDARYKQRVEHWNPSYYDFLGADLHFFNLYLEVVREAGRAARSAGGPCQDPDC